MTRTKRNAAGVVYLANMVARASIGAGLVLSFFASLAPLAVSASPEKGGMACCVGQPGHCNSGLIVKPPAPPVAEPTCGHSQQAITEKLADEKTASDRIVWGAIANDGITVVATISEFPSDQQSERAEASTKTSSKGAATATLSASFTRPCPPDCRAGAAGVVRQPRPRATALLTNRDALSPQIHFFRTSLNTVSALSASGQCTPTRGPPNSSC